MGFTFGEICFIKAEIFEVFQVSVDQGPQTQIVRGPNG
jgi:hypothetical protein